MKPVRLQLSRRKGFSLQRLSRETNGLEAVKVDRSTHWGNPFRVDEPPDQRLLRQWLWNLKPGHWDDAAGSAVEAVKRFRSCLAFDDASRDLAAKELRGKNLACWCGPYDSCHGDVLLALANPDTGGG